MKSVDWRGILGYSVQFRDQVFVLNVDSAVMVSEQFRHLLLDIAVLHNLGIRIVLAHGASHGIRELAAEWAFTPSNLDGMGPTDAPTLRAAILAANRFSHDILEGLNETDQRAAITNAIVAHPAGILQGVDQAYTGKVENVDAVFLDRLLSARIIPVLPPLGFDGNGQTFRVNSDGVALEVSEALRASKLMFVTTSNGVREAGRLGAQLSVAEAEDYLRRHQGELPPDMISKLQHGLRACKHGVSRVHIINGLEPQALLGEIFTNEGIGTMIHANEYAAIRRARKKDAAAILELIQSPVAAEELVPRTRKDLLTRIEDYFLFELDRNIVGCVGLKAYAAEHVAELECLCVAEAHENQGIGRKLINFAEQRAREGGMRRLLALSTQTFAYFQHKGGFQEGAIDLLPPERRTRYEQSGRKSKILYKDLA